MKPKRAFIFLVAVGLVSCGSGGNTSSETTDASGTYVREYAIEVANPETGNRIGMRQVRDSIFIERRDNGYQISNRKWRMNDYDQEGWVSMAHSEDRSLPTFFASYDQELGALMPENSIGAQPIFVENGRLFKGTVRKDAYQKVD